MKSPELVGLPFGSEVAIALIAIVIAVGVLLLAVLYVIYRDQITQQKALKLTRDFLFLTLSRRAVFVDSC